MLGAATEKFTTFWVSVICLVITEPPFTTLTSSFSWSGNSASQGSENSLVFYNAFHLRYILGILPQTKLRNLYLFVTLNKYFAQRHGKVWFVSIMWLNEK